MARYEQLREKGFTEDDGTQINQVAKALSEIGIRITDQAGNFRNFGTVMDELGAKWDSLSNRQQAYIATTLGGTRQESQLFNLLNGYTESMKLYKNALNDSGETQKRYNTYLSGTEAHINKLKATAEGIWLQLFDSDQIRNVVDVLRDGLTVLGQLTNSIGTLPTVLGIASAGIAMFRKNWAMINLSGGIDEMGKFSLGAIKLGGNLLGLESTFSEVATRYNTLIDTFKAGNADMMVTPTLLQRLGFGFEALTGKTYLQVGALVALKTATLALNMGIGILAGIVISKAVTAIENLINKSEKLQEATNQILTDYQQEVDKNNKNIQSLSDLSEQYSSLASKTNKSAEELKNWHDVNNKIADIAPNVVKGYDAEGNAILNLTDGVTGLISELQKKNDIESETLLGEGSTIFENMQNDAKKAKSQIDDLNKSIDETKNGHDIRVSNGNYGTDVQHVTGIKELQGDNSEEGTLQLQELQRKLSSFNSQMKVARQSLQDAKAEIAPLTEQILNQSNAYKSASDSLQNFISNQVNARIDPTQYQSIDDYKKAVEDLVNILGNVNVKVLSDEITSTNKSFQDGTMDVDTYKKKIEDLVNALLKLSEMKGLNIADIEKAFNLNLDTPSKQLKTFDQMLGEVDSAFQSNATEIANCNKVLDEYQKSGEIDIKTVVALAKAHPELLQQLGNTKQMLASVRGIVDETANDAKAQYTGELTALTNFVNEAGKAYGVDVTNLASATLAKEAILKKYNQALQTVYSNEYKLALRSGKNEEDSDMLARHARAVTQNNLDNALGGLDAIDDAIDNYYKAHEFAPKIGDYMNQIGSSSSDGKKNSGGGGGGSSTAETSEGIAINKLEVPINNVNNALDKMNNTIDITKQKVQNLQSMGTQDSLKNALLEENNLYKEQQDKVNLLTSSLTTLDNGRSDAVKYLQQNSKIMNGITGSKISEMTEQDFLNYESQMFPSKTFTGKNASKEKSDYDNARKMYEDTYKTILKYTNEIQNKQKDLLTAQNDVISTMIEKYNLQFTVYDNDLKKMERSTKNLQNEIDVFNGRNITDYATKIKLTEQLINSETEERDKIQSIVSGLRQQLNLLPQTSSEYDIINNKLDEYNDKLASSNTTIEQNNKELLQLIESQTLSLTELQIYNGQTQQQYEDNAKAQESALQNQLDAMKQADELQSEAEERQQHQVELTKLQTELTKTMNERNIQVLKQQADGSWQYEYVADQNKIDDLQSQIKDKTDDFNKWENDTARKHQEQALSNEIQNLQNQVNIRKEMYDRIKNDLDNALNNQAIDLLSGNSTLNSIIATGLQTINDTYAGKFTDIYNTVKSKVDAIKDLIASMNASVVNAVAGGNAVLSNPTSDKPTVVVKAGSADEAILKAQYGDSINIVNAGNGYVGVGTTRVETNQMYQDELAKLGIKPSNNVGDLYHFKTGGFTADGEGLAYLDKKELVLNEYDTKNILQSTELLRRLVSANVKLNQPSMNLNNNPSQNTTYVINDISFPNIKSADGLEDAFKRLPALAKQRIRTQVV